MKLERGDFEQFRTAVLSGKPSYVPLSELLVDIEAKEAFLGKPVTDIRTDIEFWQRAGYDYYSLAIGPQFHTSGRFEDERKGLTTDRKWAEESKGIITTLEEFEDFPWPSKDEIDFRPLEEASRLLPKGMKIVLRWGDIFTHTWQLMGFETFCFALVEKLELVERLFEKLGRLALAVFERGVENPSVGAIWYSDDLAYASGLMCSPEVYRKYLFPWMRRIGEISRSKDLPYIYHSDGVLWSVLRDLMEDIGINALQPIEPKAMDIREVKKKFAGSLAVIGNVQVDTLARGSPKDVEEATKALIRDVAPGGGFCLGSSNTITYYTKPENYKRMLETVKRFGNYPISL